MDAEGSQVTCPNEKLHAAEQGRERRSQGPHDELSFGGIQSEVTYYAFSQF